ncbi:MAG: ABC transporter ATP-binding protein, partial [Oscillatoriales cyanobacterium SM2_2_1]|nr:ABC transporter ATP-binding protein [Oscillatoriales cyanobacterium SM2_2_1]
LSEVTGQGITREFQLAVLMGGNVCFLGVLRAPAQPWIGDWFHWDVALRSRRDQTQRAIAKILTLPLEFYDENNPGRIAGRVARGLANHTWTYPEIAGQLIPKFCRVLGIMAVMVAIEWEIAAIFGFSFVLILVYSFRVLGKLIDKEETLDKHQENTESRTSELVTNIKTVKAFATESRELKRLSDRLNREFKKVNYRIHVGYVKLGTLRKTLIEVCTFTILVVSLQATVQGTISLGHFVTIMTLTGLAYGELEPICNLAETFARRYASMLRFHEFMHSPDGKDAQGLLEPHAATLSYQFTGQVEFRRLSFGYDPQRLVLRDINLVIDPYETVALVGRSGSGKSTLIKLLLRYFEPTSGGIYIDGQNIHDLDVTGYRQRLAVVHQEVDVFNGTLLENLTYGCPGASPEQVDDACAIARVHEFVHQLPQGFQTMVGERGVRLSGGQRQRLGIARALLVSPDVLIFDEATSSLDYESERAIQLAMAQIQGTRTTIIIAHRLSTVREADKIVVLDQGQIMEIGNHRQLLANQGLYYRLHSLQQEKGPELSRC